MILDEVFNEENRSFDKDDMVDIFTEGFLFALEMQEVGYKADSTEELSMNIAEAADIAIGELSDETINRAAQKAYALANRHARLTKITKGRNDINSYQDTRKAANNALANKYEKNANRINNRIIRKNMMKGYKGIH